MNGAMHTTAQVLPTSSVEVMETNNTEGSIVREVNQRTQKLSRPPVPRGAVVAVAAVKETAASSQDSISERRLTPAEPLGSESGSKLGSAQQGFSPACLEKSVYPLADYLAVQEGPDPIEARVTQMKKNPGFAPTSEAIAALRQFAEKARSTPSDLSRDSSDTESSKLSIPAPTPAALSRVGLITGAKLKISKDLEVSEVPFQAHGEGSGSESSTGGENEGNRLARVTASVNAASVLVHPLRDQLTALVHGPVKRGPRPSVLDEIPSSSETGSESGPEDLMLDEEEDISRQPSYKQSGGFSTTRQFSIESEHTSTDEGNASVPIYMDTPREVFNPLHVRIL